MTDLHTAARAVLKRWDSPQWDWQQEGPTADLMAALRAALDAVQAQPVAFIPAEGLAHLKAGTGPIGVWPLESQCSLPVPLYTTPQAPQPADHLPEAGKMVPLTDERKLDILRRWKSTHAPRLEALEGLLRTAQLEAEAGREAVATLASERSANALLTNEVERLRTELAAERERCATVCERLAAEEHAERLKQPEGSPARDRYFARQEALRGAAVEMRLGA